MFAVPVFSVGHHQRAGWPQLISEFVATFGLLSVIWGAYGTSAKLRSRWQWRAT
jgi:hypothetical protein